MNEKQQYNKKWDREWHRMWDRRSVTATKDLALYYGWWWRSNYPKEKHKRNGNDELESDWHFYSNGCQLVTAWVSSSKFLFFI